MNDPVPHPKPAHLLKADAWHFEYREKCNPYVCNLELLSYGTYRLAPAATSGELFHRGEEAILFCLQGRQEVDVDGQIFPLAHYDTLYVPFGTPYRIANVSDELADLVVCRAPGQQRHEPVHSVWERVCNDETRIRHLQGKDVFMMFDVTESADKLMAGYTVYQPHTRSWPPHNHSDQEEVYILTKGRGSVEVYADEQSKTFVHSIENHDAVTIPLMNYHPVFSQNDELHFIWCMAGERYWVGDKHKEFMDATIDKLTT